MSGLSGNKSTLTAYFLWLIGGILGLHHYYLGRDLHGFLWFCTLGGYFGLGWLRDVFHIREYVSEANEDGAYYKRMMAAVVKNAKPPFSCTRFIGMILVAYYWSFLFYYAIPEEEVGGINWTVLHLLTPFACAVGVWTVGNIGNQEGGLITPVIAAYLTFPLKYVMDESNSFTIMILASAFAFDMFEKKWRLKKRKLSCLKRMLIITGWYLLLISMLFSYVYFNMKITDNDGEEIPVREAFHHFLKSPWWTDLKQSLYDLWHFAMQHGWIETWRQIIDISDPYGENNAYKVLGLTSSASQSEINSQCRNLAVKYHPDKVKDEEEKRKAQEKFYEVQQACEILSSSRVKRRSKNKKFRSNEEL